MASPRELPIGVFDSGVGGLTVVRALMERLPLEHIVYFGDTARVPYGIKSIPTIEHFTGQITDFLMERGVKMLIVACNTMAAVAVLRSPGVPETFPCLMSSMPGRGLRWKHPVVAISASSARPPR